MNGGERTSLGGLDTVTPSADLGRVEEWGGEGAGARVPDRSANGPNLFGCGGFVLLRSPDASTIPAGTMVNEYSQS